MRTPAIASLLLVVAVRGEAQQQAENPTGHRIIGLPVVNYDADEGLGFGGALNYYDYGIGVARPYRYDLQTVAFGTTRGRTDLTLFLDAPHWLPDQWRLGFQLALERQKVAPYYGVGNNTVAIDIPPDSPNQYFYRFERTVLRSNADFQHPLLASGLRYLVGAGTRTSTVNTVSYGQGTSLLELQTLRKELPKIGTRYGRVGLVYDTRDNEIATHSGNWSDFLVQRAGKVLGGDEVFTRITGTVRQYFPLHRDFTLAERLVMQNVDGNPAISEIFSLQSTYRDDEFLGGATTIRGLPKNRYVGKGVEFLNSELRWSAKKFEVRKRPMELVWVAFADVGRVWADQLDLSEVFSDLHAGYGAGARVRVGPSFVFSVDLGHSSQSAAALYIGQGYLY